MNFFCNKYLILVLSFFQPMILNVGGEISPTFLFILFTSPFWMQQLKFRQDRLLKYFVVLFVFLVKSNNNNIKNNKKNVIGIGKNINGINKYISVF